MSQIRKPGKPLEFVIDGFRPDTLPMGRLAAYMTDLAKLLGSEPGVHFDKVKEGSARLVHYVDEEVRPEVEHRLRLVKRGMPMLRLRLQSPPLTKNWLTMVRRHT